MRTDNKAAIALSSKRRQGSLNLVYVMHTESDQLDLECRSPDFCKFEEVNTGGRLGMHHVPDALNLRHDLLEKLQPFSAHRAFPIGESCKVAVGTSFVAH